MINCEYYAERGLCHYEPGDGEERDLRYINKCFVYGSPEEKIRKLKGACDIRHYLDSLRSSIKRKI